MDALADQIRTVIQDDLPDIQVEPRMVLNPTPLCVDVYPADPAQEQMTFGNDPGEALFTVRARVNTVEHEEAQDLLLELMDPRSNTSVWGALQANPTLTGKVGQVIPGRPSGFLMFQDASGQAGSLLGVQWVVRVIL